MGFLASYAKVAMPNPAPYLPPIMTDVVIDLYHGDNVNVDFSVIRSENIDAVILKASQGTWTDPAFLERVQEVRAAGLLVGAYHFLDGSSPADQIAHFLTVAKSEAGIEWLAIDWEPYPPSQATVMQAATAAASIYAATNNGRNFIRSARCFLHQIKHFQIAISGWPNTVPGRSARLDSRSGNCGNTPMVRSGPGSYRFPV